MTILEINELSSSEEEFDNLSQPVAVVAEHSSCRWREAEEQTEFTVVLC